MKKLFYSPDQSAALECWTLSGEQARGGVVICPGGGYEFVSEREGAPVAQAFNRAGYHAFLLKYTVERPPLVLRPLHQLAWAMMQLRQQAENLQLDPNKLALCGFSAGGHLAASLAVFWQRPEFFVAGTNLAAQRPNALILAYPVISAGVYAHRGTFERLAGPEPAEQARFSLEHQVSRQTPPSFLWHTIVDRSVPVQNSLLFAQALLENSVPFELHLYPNGAHGMSLATPEVQDLTKGKPADPHLAGWFAIACEWLEGIFAQNSAQI